MNRLNLCIEIFSPATFGRGDGLAGVVDQEIEQDENGLPFARGRVIKGLLAEECANLLYALGPEQASGWWKAARDLFGSPGSRLEDQGKLRVGDARLPEALIAAVQAALADGDSGITREAVTESLTAVRRQTSMNAGGAPEPNSLRSVRVLLPGITLESELLLGPASDDRALPLLAACVLALRRAGMARNRGRGRLQARLLQEGADVTRSLFAKFAGEVTA